MSEQDQAMRQRIRQCSLRIARLRAISIAEENGRPVSSIWPPNLTKAALKLYETDKALYNARAAEIIALEDAPL